MLARDASVHEPSVALVPLIGPRVPRGLGSRQHMCCGPVGGDGGLERVLLATWNMMPVANDGKMGKLMTGGRP